MMMNPHIASKKESSSSSSAENFLKKGHRALNSTEIADYNAGLYIGPTRLVWSSDVNCPLLTFQFRIDDISNFWSFFCVVVQLG